MAGQVVGLSSEPAPRDQFCCRIQVVNYPTEHRNRYALTFSLKSWPHLAVKHCCQTRQSTQVNVSLCKLAAPSTQHPMEKTEGTKVLPMTDEKSLGGHQLEKHRWVNERPPSPDAVDTGARLPRTEFV